MAWTTKVCQISVDLIEVLFDGLNMHDAIPEAELRAALRQAIFSEPLTRDAIERNLNRFASQYIRREPTNFVLITTVSAVGQMPTSNPDPGGCHLSFAAQIPAPFVAGRLAQVEAAGRSLRAMPRADATFVSIAVTGRSDHQAAEKALRALDLQRGIWNFFSTQEQQPTSRLWEFDAPSTRYALAQCTRFTCLTDGLPQILSGMSPSTLALTM